MSYGVNAVGSSSFGAPNAELGADVTINCTVGNAVSTGLAATVTTTVFDYRIAVIGDSNASGRATNNQPAPVANTWLYNNAGSIVALADPWDGGADTYSALDDTSASGSFIPRLAQHFYDAGKTTLWVPANKGGTSAAEWTRSLSTTTCYGAMKARIDAAGGVDKILVVLGANDAIGGVSQSTFISRINQLVADLLSDFPTAEVYLQKIQTLSGYPAQSAIIRAGVTEVWNGSSGVKPGADLDGITSDVHYTTDANVIAVAERTYPALVGTMVHGVVGNAVAQGVSALVSIFDVVTADNSDTYVIRSSVFSDDSESYSVQSAVSADSVTVFGVLSSTTVASSNTVAYSLRATASINSDLLYAIRGQVVASADANYSLRVAVLADVAAGYNIAAAAWAVQADNQAAYTIGGVLPACPTAAQIAQAVWQHTIEGGISAEALQRILLAALVGTSERAGSTITFTSPVDGATVRITGSFDAENNRTGVILDGD